MRAGGQVDRRMTRMDKIGILSIDFHCNFLKKQCFSLEEGRHTGAQAGRQEGRRNTGWKSEFYRSFVSLKK